MVNIHSIELRNYRNIKDAKVDLGRFNVLIGPNNSGKSNFLQIFNLLNFFISEDITVVERCFSGKAYDARFNIKPSGDKVNDDFFIEIKFSSKDEETIFSYSLSISYGKDGKSINGVNYFISSESLDFKKCNTPGKATSIFKRESEKIVFGDALKKTHIIESIPNYASVLRILNLIISKSENHIYNIALESIQHIINTPVFYFSNVELSKGSFASNTRIKSFEGRVISSDLENEIAYLMESGNKMAYEAALKEILKIEDVFYQSYDHPFENEGKIKAKEKTDETNYVVFVNHLSSFKSINKLSDGSLLLLALITKLFSSKNSLFLIEEPENSIHPKALLDLINLLRSFQGNKQFLITSHSMPLVSLCKPEELLFSSIDKSGRSEIHRLSNISELRRKLKSGYINFSDEIFFGDLENYF